MQTNSKKLAPRAVADREAGIILAIADVTAPPERVFKALVTKETENWWGDEDTYRVTEWKEDLRLGGKWSLVVLRPDGTKLPASGEFLELDFPNKIVLTRRYDWDAPALGRRVTKVTYLLYPEEDVTRLTIRHEGFEGCIEAAYEHAFGWERYLTWLESYLSRA